MKARTLHIGILVIIGLLVLTATQSLAGPWHRGKQRLPLFELTEDQREEIHQLVIEMRDDGAPRDEIHDAVVELLEGWGIEIPGDLAEGPREIRRMGAGFRERLGQGNGERGPGPCDGEGPGHGPRAIFRDLTPEQRQEIRATVRAMRDEGTTREEIRDAVRGMLEVWGVELPERLDRGTAVQSRNSERIQARNYPNPFNPSTEIAYSLDSSADVRIEIYNVAGQAVRTFDLGYQASGEHSVHWDGLDSSGAPAASGIYYYRIQAGNDVLTDDMILLK
jgi:hypothetical protein